MDFGGGFYTRPSTWEGFTQSSSWAIKAARYENSFFFHDLSSTAYSAFDNQDFRIYDSGSWSKSYPMIMVVGVEKQQFRNMTKVDYGTPEQPVQPNFSIDVNAYRAGHQLFAGTDYVVGPTAKPGAGGVWTVDRRLTIQYKFEPQAFVRIKLLGITPAFDGVQIA